MAGAFVLVVVVLLLLLCPRRPLPNLRWLPPSCDWVDAHPLSLFFLVIS